ncbi:AmmeMemoRadiSam system protein B, partial [Candidatus Bathyarchaeota archaeon]|nr:AmmeMemoRadiSam system protein B [Candidatus Bathyarchaeota archaeon]
MKIRKPSAWGFHPFNRDEEVLEIERSFLSKHGVGRKPAVSAEGPRKMVGLVVPHAGYAYSGPVASHAYYEIAGDGVPETFVLLGPTHSSRFPGYSAMIDGVWKMPLGEVSVDSDLAKEIVQSSSFIDINPEAHDNEHSIEVQLPFLQYVYGDQFRIVPIAVGYSDHAMIMDAGRAIAKAISGMERDSVVVATTDLTHYGSAYGYTPVGMSPFTKVYEWIQDVDRSIIDLIVALDASALLKTVTEKGYTMCGATPVATMLIAARALGAKSGKLLKYTTSYDV